jgi:hypothetical protein
VARFFSAEQFEGDTSMRINRPGMDTTIEAGADLSTHQFKFVIGVAGVAGGQQARVNVSGANGRTIGVLQNKPNAAGLGAVVRVSGTSKLVVDGTVAIAAGNPLKADASGRGVLAATDKDKVGGIALEPSTAANDIIEALVVHYDLAV